MIQRAFDGGALADLTADDLARLLKGISAHSTRVGLNQDLFTSGEDLAGIMDALRWKSPRMPLAYNRNLAAEAGAAGRSEEHTSELQSLMRISYAVFCLKKKKQTVTRMITQIISCLRMRIMSTHSHM